MFKAVFSTLMCVVLLPLAVLAQETQTDTIRTNQITDVSRELEESNDVVTVGDGPASNWFIGVGVGFGFLNAEANRVYDKFYNRFEPAFTITGGKWFTPAIALRSQIMVGQLSGHNYGGSIFNIFEKGEHFQVPSQLRPDPTSEWVHRRFYYTGVEFDFLTDVVKWFTPDDKKLGWYIFAGPGFAHAFRSQGIQAGNSFTFDAGTQLDYKFSKNWSIFVEAKGVIVNETFDGLVGGKTGDNNREVEGFATVTAGITYRFGGSKFKSYKKINPVTLETVYYQQQPIVQEDIVEEDMTIPFIVRFRIDKYNIEDDQVLNIFKVAQYLKQNPDAKLDLAGYADKETAYPAYNLKLSKRRVEAVKNYIVDTYGIAPERINTEAKGDMERLYNEDYRWNRAVVMQIVE
ncbi:MAG: OmpA family protein [Bacteroidales bacterium]|nr:OmpA family protein [Bacteroidales bacterium]